MCGQGPQMNSNLFHWKSKEKVNRKEKQVGITSFSLLYAEKNWSPRLYFLLLFSQKVNGLHPSRLKVNGKFCSRWSLLSLLVFPLTTTSSITKSKNRATKEFEKEGKKAKQVRAKYLLTKIKKQQQHQQQQRTLQAK